MRCEPIFLSDMLLILQFLLFFIITIHLLLLMRDKRRRTLKTRVGLENQRTKDTMCVVVGDTKFSPISIFSTLSSLYTKKTINPFSKHINNLILNTNDFSIHFQSDIFHLLKQWKCCWILKKTQEIRRKCFIHMKYYDHSGSRVISNRSASSTRFTLVRC